MSSFIYVIFIIISFKFTVKSEEKLMLSKMSHLVDWLYSLVAAKEPETSMNSFLQVIMNIIRKERFKSSKE